MKLLSFDTIAVDRHIISFIESAGLSHANYNSTKKTVEFAADLLNVSRSSLDATIWYYMSEKNTNIRPDTNQLRFIF
jgi:thermostable 8-oxoguanine DNA glycosylase